MFVITKDSNSADVRISAVECMLLANTLNEILNGIEMFEFHARLGGTREEVEGLRSQIADLFRGFDPIP